MIYEYKGRLYPHYLKGWNGAGHIQPIALEFCQGKGLDVGAGKWPLHGAMPIDTSYSEEFSAHRLPDGPWDYIFSSHCLEHVADAISALEYWISLLKHGGTLYLYLPHPDMKYWQPQHNRKHLHSWMPAEMAQIFDDLGLTKIIYSERDMYWSFSVVGFKK